ncbi:MAG: hypothetical protein KDC50_05310 [Flavobacterium sp.]|nr:hypothetical protein [Flavobacterium sp.]
MKNKILTIGFILLSIVVSGQEKSNANLLETDSTWNQEVFHFPIGFAPEIAFKGFEDARFPQNWSKKDSNDFWSYVFVWSINNPVEITSSALEDNIEMYFNGLMNYQNSVALFFEKEPSSKAKRYSGKIKIFDALVTKTNMTLNVTAEHYYCDQSKTTFIIFRFSPQEFGLEIWEKLEKVKLRKDFCDR